MPIRGKKIIGGLAVTMLVFSLVLACTSGKETAEKASSGKSKSDVSEGTSKDTEKKTETKKLEVVKSGYSKNKGGTLASYGAIIRNPNKDKIAENIDVTITLFGDQNQVIASSSMDKIPYLEPEKEIGIGNEIGISPEGANISKIEVQARPSKWSKKTKDMAGFQFENVNFIKGDDYGSNVTGIIKSTFSKDLKDIQVSTIYFDQNENIIGGNSTYVDFVPANGQTSFQVYPTELELKNNIAKVQAYGEVTSLTALELESREE